MTRGWLAGIVVSVAIHGLALFLLLPAGPGTREGMTNGSTVLTFKSGLGAARGNPAPAGSVRSGSVPKPVRPASTDPAFADAAPVGANGSAPGADGETVGAETGAPAFAARDAFITYLAARKIYPARARDKGIEGNVGLRVDLDARGRARLLEIRRSSGSSLLDQAALELVRSSLPFPHGLETGFQADITIAYRLGR